MMIGGATIFVVVLGLEWLQLSIPGRTADLTQALIAVAGWCAPLVLAGRSAIKPETG